VTEPAPEPPLFEHSDKTGATFYAAPGRIWMSRPDGTSVTLELLGENAYPLDPIDLVAAISSVVGRQLVAVPAVPDGWLVEHDPDRVRVGDDYYSPEEAVARAGRLGSAVMQLRHERRAEQQAEVDRLAATIAGRSTFEDIPEAERAQMRAAARRVLSGTASA
jgi:hypothetical protein